MPLRRSTSAVPAVATISNPRSASRFTGKTIARLSRLATETNTRPFVGSDPYDAVCDFANAGPNDGVDAHHLAGRLHLRAEQRVDARALRACGTGGTAAPPP